MTTTPATEQTIMDSIAARVLDILQRAIQARVGAIGGGHLATRLGCTSREIREAVRTLRRQGHPIGSASSSPAGYWYCSDRQEAIETRERLWGRIKEQIATVRALECAHHLGDSQLTLMTGADLWEREGDDENDTR